MLTSFLAIDMSYYRSICGLITIKSNNDHEYVDIIMLTWHITPLLLCYSMVSTSRKRILEEAAVVLKDQVSSMLLKQTNESAVEDLYFGLILIILGQIMCRDILIEFTYCQNFMLQNKTFKAETLIFRTLKFQINCKSLTMTKLRHLLTPLNKFIFRTFVLSETYDIKA